MEKYKDKPFVLLGVNLDPQRAAAHDASLAANLTWRSWWGGDGKISTLYGAELLPTMFLIDTQGVLRASIPPEEIGRMEEHIDRLLAEVSGP